MRQAVGHEQHGVGRRLPNPRNQRIGSRRHLNRNATPRQAIRQPILEKYEREGSPYYATARLWDDGLLDPVRTRDTLALGLSAAYNAPIPDARFGIFRM